MKRSTEILSHFQCKACDKWWSVGDAPADKKTWFCPWCGLGQMEDDVVPQNAGKVPEADYAAELSKAWDEAGEEMKKFFTNFEHLFKKK